MLAVLAIPLSHLAGYEAKNCSRAGNHNEQERVRHKHGATFLLRFHINVSGLMGMRAFDKTVETQRLK
jgi:hypothetical protein